MPALAPALLSARAAAPAARPQPRAAPRLAASSSARRVAPRRLTRSPRATGARAAARVHAMLPAARPLRGSAQRARKLTRRAHQETLQADAPPCAGAGDAAPPASAVYDHVLLAVVDANPYLSSGTRAAVAAAVAHAQAGGAPGAPARLTVLVADGAPLPPGVDAGVRVDTLRWHLSAAGWEAPEGAAPDAWLLQRVGENPAAAISDAADEAGASLVVLAASAVHAKDVNMNLLCEFLPCPLLLVPL
jgi:hypothetical protein